MISQRSLIVKGNTTFHADMHSDPFFLAAMRFDMFVSTELYYKEEIFKTEKLII